MTHKTSKSPDRGPRFLLYSHDTVGLGNLRRTLFLTKALRRAFPRSSILIVTGSPLIHAFRLPAGTDYVKIPCLYRSAPETYAPRQLTGADGRVQELRRRMLCSVFASWAPDLAIVDKKPLGVGGELRQALELLRRRHPSTRVVLGMRDILDAPDRARRSLLEGGFEAIESYYDEIWIFGRPEVYDLPREVGFPDSINRKTVFLGYLTHAGKAGGACRGPREVLVTIGGGDDGQEIVDRYLTGITRFSPPEIGGDGAAIHSTLLLGPLMPHGAQERIRRRAAESPEIDVLDFTADPAPLYARSSLVVSMAGYGTICDLLSHRRRAILVPRTTPVREQLIRARRFAELGFFDLIEPDCLTPQLLMERMGAVLAAEDRPPAFGGRTTLITRTSSSSTWRTL